MSVLDSIFNRNTLGAGFVALTSVFVASTDAEARKGNGNNFIRGLNAATRFLDAIQGGGGYGADYGSEYGGNRGGGRHCKNVPVTRDKFVNGRHKEVFSHTKTVCRGDRGRGLNGLNFNGF